MEKTNIAGSVFLNKTKHFDLRSIDGDGGVHKSKPSICNNFFRIFFWAVKTHLNVSTFLSDKNSEQPENNRTEFRKLIKKVFELRHKMKYGSNFPET